MGLQPFMIINKAYFFQDTVSVDNDAIFNIF